MQIDPIEAAIKAGEFDLVSLDEFNEFIQSQNNIKTEIAVYLKNQEDKLVENIS